MLQRSVAPAAASSLLVGRHNDLCVGRARVVAHTARPPRRRRRLASRSSGRIARRRTSAAFGARGVARGVMRLLGQFHIRRCQGRLCGVVRLQDLDFADLHGDEDVVLNAEPLTVLLQHAAHNGVALGVARPPIVQIPGLAVLHAGVRRRHNDLKLPQLLTVLLRLADTSCAGCWWRWRRRGCIGPALGLRGPAHRRSAARGAVVVAQHTGAGHRAAHPHPRRRGRGRGLGQLAATWAAHAARRCHGVDPERRGLHADAASGPRRGVGGLRHRRGLGGGRLRQSR
mmetsp:Transcript_115518/g.333706  ORF Transcript_115518/g.333706 Transcript_115518/m.333706 type:complete len:285 (-) Transcript_115518:504-1358(-)